MTKIYQQYLAQLYQNNKFKRYLRDDRNTPFSFPSRSEANLFANQYLKTRARKSFSIKIVEISIQLPKPENLNV